MRALLVVATLAVFAASCASTSSPEVAARLSQIASTVQPERTASGAFAIVNERDEDATRLRGVPVGFAGGFSCNTGIHQLGDSSFGADRIARLENALVAAFPDRSQGATLLVRRYDVYLNAGAEADAVAMGAAMGSVGVFSGGGAPSTESPTLWRRPKCERERMLGGWFDSADLANNFPPISVDIEVNVFGRDYVVNAALSPEANLMGEFRFMANSAATEATVQRAMDRANARLIEQIRTNQ